MGLEACGLNGKERAMIPATQSLPHLMVTVALESPKTSGKWLCLCIALKPRWLSNVSALCFPLQMP